MRFCVGCRETYVTALVRLTCGRIVSAGCRCVAAIWQCSPVLRINANLFNFNGLCTLIEYRLWIDSTLLLLTTSWTFMYDNSAFWERVENEHVDCCTVEHQQGFINMAPIFPSFLLQLAYNQKVHYLPNQRKSPFRKFRIIKRLGEKAYFASDSMALCPMQVTSHTC